MNINPNHQNIQINLRSDDEQVQGSTTGDSELDFQFGRVIEIPPNYCLNISANEVEIPNTYYTFSQNMVIQTIFKGSTGDVWTMESIIEPQHLTPCLLIQIYKSEQIKFKALNPTADSFPNLTFNCNTLKFLITSANANTGFTFTFAEWDVTTETRITPKLSDALMFCRFFGIPKSVLVAGVPTIIVPDFPVGKTPFAESNNCVDTAKHHNIYLTLGNNFTTDSIDSLSKSSENCLAKIPVNAPFGSMINYSGNSKDSYLFRGLHFGRLSLALRDHEGELIELNGVRFNVSILVEFVKKDFDIVRDLPQALPLETHSNYHGLNQNYMDYKPQKTPDKKRRLTRTFNTKKFVADIRKILGN